MTNATETKQQTSTCILAKQRRSESKNEDGGCNEREWIRGRANGVGDGLGYSIIRSRPRISRKVSTSRSEGIIK